MLPEVFIGDIGEKTYSLVRFISGNWRYLCV